MKQLLQLVILALVLAPSALAQTYVSQSGGSVSCGNDGTKTTTAVASVTWTGGVYKGCGTFTSAFTINASGTSSNPITFQAESNWTLTMSAIPSTGGIILNNQSWIIIDGDNQAGIIQGTANGDASVTCPNSSLCASQVNSVGISASGAGNIVIQ